MDVKDLMVTDVITIGRNDDLRLVDDIMSERRIRHIPVLEDDKIVGVVTQRDVFKARMSSTMGYGEKGQREFLHTVRVKEVMAHPVITVTPATPVTEATDLIITKGIGCLPVVQDDRLIGIITKTNLLQRLRTLDGTAGEASTDPQAADAYGGDKTHIDKGLSNVMSY
jgi:CBS domain-containing protein